MQAAASRVTTEAPKIDISHLSLEALPDPGLLVAPSKPKPPPDEPYLPRPGIDLMLAPLDEHLEKPEREEARPAHSRVKADLGENLDIGSLALEALAEVEDQTPAHRAIPRVLVLGASIGGPDALRTFLAGLPADFPALLVLAQHLESGFFDRLAQQLQRVSKLPVRVASSDAPACAGEVMVIPSGERIRIQRDGRVRREPYPGPTHYRPCIDDVMRDIADAFGSRATAIIFSGMAGDAVEGAVYVTSKGGEVWAQTPDSCVVSSMVDGAQARGVVEFLGSPRELAEHCVERYGAGA
jgi:chemotaxis response regulator CheB